MKGTIEAPIKPDLTAFQIDALDKSNTYRIYCDILNSIAEHKPVNESSNLGWVASIQGDSPEHS